MALSDTKIRKAKPEARPYKLADGGGLYLDVRPTGGKFWRYRFHLAGREGAYSIGEYPAVTLTKARAERDQAKAWARAGINPSQERDRLAQIERADLDNSFEAVAREFAEKQGGRWTPYYSRQWHGIMAADVFPAFGGVPIREVTAHELLRLLRSVEQRGAPTVAVNIRLWCSQVFRYGVSTLRVDTDPAAALTGAIIRKPVRHNPGIDRAGIRELLVKLDGYAGYRQTVIAIHLLLRLFPRTVELRKASWAEFDLPGRTWSLPAERMKMRRAHLVPLSTQAVDFLEELHTLTGGQPWLLPNFRRPSDVITGTTINRALERMGYAGTLSGHGFRTTASTLLNEMGYRADLIERQLAHTSTSGVRAAYNHAEYLDERRAMMQAWADLIDGERS